MPSLYGSTSTYSVFASQVNTLYQANTGTIITGTVQANNLTGLYLGSYSPLPNTAEALITYFDNNGTVQFALDPTTGDTKILANAPFSTATIDVFSGTAVQQSFTLSQTPLGTQWVEVVVGGVVQTPVDSYTVTGNQVLFVQAPPAGQDNIQVRYYGLYSATVVRGPTGPSGATIVGPTGATGVPGANGAPGATGPSGAGIKILGSVATYTALPGYPSGYSGSNGDAYVTTNTGHLWVWASPNWTDIGQFTGPTGATGASGPSSGSTSTLQQVLLYGNTSTVNATIQNITIGNGIIPTRDKLYDLGNSSFRFNNVFLGTNLAWNGYTIVPPNGSTSTFLRNDGTWAYVASGAGLSGPSGASGARGPSGPTAAPLAFSYYMSTATVQTVNYGVVVPVIINTKLYDSSTSSYDTINNWFKPSQAGFYQVNGNITYTNTASGAFAAGFQLNGDVSQVVAYDLIEPNPYSTIGVTPSASTVIYLNGTTDYVQLVTFQSSNEAGWDINPASTASVSFSAARVGETLALIGPSGPSGASGVSGAIGPSGPSGPAGGGGGGASGPSGPSGPSGSGKGYPGLTSHTSQRIYTQTQASFTLTIDAENTTAYKIGDILRISTIELAYASAQIISISTNYLVVFVFQCYSYNAGNYTPIASILSGDWGFNLSGLTGLSGPSGPQNTLSGPSGARGPSGPTAAPIAFNYYMNTSTVQTVPFETITPVVINTKLYDSGTLTYNTSYNRFVPTSAGFYQLNGNVTYVNTTTGGLAAGIQINGENLVAYNLIEASPNGLTPIAPNVSTVVYMNVGEFAQLVTYQSSNVEGWDIFPLVGGSVSFSAAKVGETIGLTGPTGASGPSGTGVSGPSGASGVGVSGPTGPTGAIGPSGPAGGGGGASGPSGPSGTPGVSGPSGPSGINGNNGFDGNRGPSGPQGPSGTPGGPSGPSGVSITGPSGPQGPTFPILGSGSFLNLSVGSSFIFTVGTLLSTTAYSIGNYLYIRCSAGSAAGQITGITGIQLTVYITDLFDTAGNPITSLSNAIWTLVLSGKTGLVGPSGARGPSGSLGPSGPQGPRGFQGPDGAASNVSGPSGPTGAVGPTGPVGSIREQVLFNTNYNYVSLGSAGWIVFVVQSSYIQMWILPNIYNPNSYSFKLTSTTNTLAVNTISFTGNVSQPPTTVLTLNSGQTSAQITVWLYQYAGNPVFTSIQNLTFSFGSGLSYAVITGTK